MHAALFASITLGLKLPAIVDALNDSDAPMWWDGRAAMVIGFAFPILLLLPVVLLAPLWLRWRGAARLWPAAAVVAYGCWAAPPAVFAIRLIPDALRDEAEVDAYTRPARLAMRAGPEAAARRDAAAGQPGFLGVAGFAVSTSGVENRCVLARFQRRVIVGTSDVSMTPRHLVFQGRAAEFALRYNHEMARLLGLSLAELRRDERCAITAGVGFWPSWPRRVR
jgi:hypothetical protein